MVVLGLFLDLACHFLPLLLSRHNRVCHRPSIIFHHYTRCFLSDISAPSSHARPNRTETDNARLNADYAAVDAVVEATHRHKEIFYADAGMG